MTTTVSSYASSAPEKGVIGKELEEEGSDSLPLPSFVDFVFRLRGVVYKNGKVQEKENVYPFPCLFWNVWVLDFIYRGKYPYRNARMAGFHNYVANLVIVGTSRLDFLGTGFATLAQHDKK